MYVLILIHGTMSNACFSLCASDPHLTHLACALLQALLQVQSLVGFKSIRSGMLATVDHVMASFLARCAAHAST